MVHTLTRLVTCVASQPIDPIHALLLKPLAPLLPGSHLALCDLVH